MATKDYQQEIGATAECVIRGVHATGDRNPLPDYLKDEDNLTTKLFLGDS